VNDIEQADFEFIYGVSPDEEEGEVILSFIESEAKAHAELDKANRTIKRLKKKLVHQHRG
jgi:hypothetical protein